MEAIFFIAGMLFGGVVCFMAFNIAIDEYERRHRGKK